MRPGELALIFPFSVHSFDFDLSKRFRFWIVSFSGNFVNSFLRMMENRSGKEKTFALAGTASSFVKEALFEQEKETAENLLLVKSALYAVTSLYLEAIPTEEKKASEKLSLAERVLNHVSAHYPEKLTLTSMARSLGYSASYLSHGFGKLFNMSFSSYLNLYRIDQAEILLLNTDLSIIEIADQTGFSSIRNFNYVFRSVYGTSPREYRKIKGAFI